MSLLELTNIEFGKAQKLIYQMCGIRISEKKRTLLNNRLRRRLRATGCEDFRTYLKQLDDKSNHDEIEKLLNEVTTNETCFFRTEKHFDWLASQFIDEMVSQAREGLRDRSIRIWSAASSTGEEPYSMAMCLHEHRYRLKDWNIEIVGTDLNLDALELAGNGEFKERAISLLDDKRRKKYFTHIPEVAKWQLKESIRQMVSFKRHNLIKPWSGPKFDCVFLRNVLIYFDQQSKEKVVEQITKAIKSGGYLVTGPSEGIFDMLPGFTKHSTFLYQKQ